MEEKDNIEISEEGFKKAKDVLEDIFDAFTNTLDSWEEKKKENLKFLENNYHHIGRIVNCHLIIENLINKEIEKLYKLDENKLRILKLTYFQKLGLLPINNNIYNFLLPGILQLNKIRNHISHNLQAVIDDNMMTDIDSRISKKKLANNLSIEERIEAFTRICISMFSISSLDTKKHWKALEKKYPFIKGIIRMTKTSFNKMDFLKTLEEIN